MRVKLLSFMMAAALFSVPFQAGASESTSQITEATAFLKELLQQTDNPIIANFAQEGLSKLRNPEPPQVNKRHVEVPLMGRANSLAVPVMLNRRYTATFLVDTGATYTVLTPRIASQLGIVATPDTPKISIITANGPIQAPLVTLESVSIGNLEVSHVKVIVQDLGRDTLICGLLGMNFFKDMDFSIRQNKLVLSVSEAS